MLGQRFIMEKDNSLDKTNKIEQDRVLKVDTAFDRLYHKKKSADSKKSKDKLFVYRKSLRLVQRWVETGYMFRKSNSSKKSKSDSRYQDKLLASLSQNISSLDSGNQDLDLKEKSHVIVYSSPDSTRRSTQKSSSKKDSPNSEKLKVIETHDEKKVEASPEKVVAKPELVPKSDASCDSPLIFVSRFQKRETLTNPEIGSEEDTITTERKSEIETKEKTIQTRKKVVEKSEIQSRERTSDTSETESSNDAIETKNRTLKTSKTELSEDKIETRKRTLEKSETEPRKYALRTRRKTLKNSDTESKEYTISTRRRTSEKSGIKPRENTNETGRKNLESEDTVESRKKFLDTSDSSSSDDATKTRKRTLETSGSESSEGIFETRKRTLRKSETNPRGYALKSRRKTLKNSDIEPKEFTVEIREDKNKTKKRTLETSEIEPTEYTPKTREETLEKLELESKEGAAETSKKTLETSENEFREDTIKTKKGSSDELKIECTGDNKSQEMNLSDSGESDLIYDSTLFCNRSKSKFGVKRKKKLFVEAMSDEVYVSSLSKETSDSEERGSLHSSLINHPALKSDYRRKYDVNRDTLNTSALYSMNDSKATFAKGAVRVSEGTRDFLEKTCEQAKNSIEKEISQLAKKRA